MFLRRRSLLFLFLPAIGYAFVMYALIGRTCREDSYAEADYEEEDGAPQERAALGTRNNGLPFERSREIFVPARSKKAPRFRTLRGERAKDSRQTTSSEFTRNFAGLRKPSYPFNCTNISKMKLKKKIGHGVSKQTFLGELQGHPGVAVKMVTRHIHDVKTCLDSLRGGGGGGGGGGAGGGGRGGEDEEAADTAGARSRCYAYSTLKLMKEVLLAEQLSHPNVAQLLGYCVRSEESDSTDVAEHGVVSVFELGSRFVLDGLQILPWPVKLRHALELADLLDYLQRSPLGSLVIPDFKEGHFVIVNSSLKLIDLDDVNNVEPACEAASAPAAAAVAAAPAAAGGSDSGVVSGREEGGEGVEGEGEGEGEEQRGHRSECEYGVRCQRALCVGFNAKENLKNMNRLILKRLLFPLTFPEAVVREVGQLNAQLDLLTLSAADLRDRLLLVQARAHRVVHR